MARGSPVQTKLACVEVPFPLGVLPGGGALRARHGVLLLADEDIQGPVYSIQGPARAPAGSIAEELAQGDVIALADEPTCRLPMRVMEMMMAVVMVMVVVVKKQNTPQANCRGARPNINKSLANSKHAPGKLYRNDAKHKQIISQK